MTTCRVCDAELHLFLDLGRMPLANAFLTEDQFATEPFYHLRAAACPRCSLVQLVEQPARELMFNEQYPFFTATSTRMAAHFAALASEVLSQLPAPDPFVVELGSNDGTLLRHVAAAGVRHLGVEPSASVAKAATANGVQTICRFFDVAMAKEIVAEHGQADSFIAANALSHIANPHTVIEGIKLLLAPDGICIIEDPYWGDVLEQTAFDQIYDEHASYFTVTSLSNLFAMHGLSIRKAEPVKVHGGSMRYLIRHAWSKGGTADIDSLRAREQRAALHAPETLAGFRQRVDDIGSALVTLLRERRAQGMRIAGYGATSKSTTSLNYFGIGPDLVEFVSDTTPAKQGRFTPGTHISVRPYEEFVSRMPDRALLLAWNHAEEIRAREQAFSERGGRWIRYVPRVEEV